MAREQKNAVLICLILSLTALAGIFTGISFKKPVLIIILMLPSVIYEVYRTEGIFTRLSSLAILGILFAEIILIVGKINMDLVKFAGKSGIKTGNLNFPNIDIKTAGAAVTAMLALFLLRRTGGRYTIWLAVIILISSIALVYSLNQELFQSILNSGFKETMRNIR